MADTSSYNLSDLALQNVRQKIEQARLAGKTVTPAEMRSMYEGEFQAIQSQRTANRGMDIQQSEFAQSQGQQASEFQKSLALQKQMAQGASTGGFVQAGTQLAGSALMGKGGQYLWNKLLGTPKTTPGSFTGAGSVSPNPSAWTGDVTTGPYNFSTPSAAAPFDATGTMAPPFTGAGSVAPNTAAFTGGSDVMAGVTPATQVGPEAAGDLYSGITQATNIGPYTAGEAPAAGAAATGTAVAGGDVAGLTAGGEMSLGAGGDVAGLTAGGEMSLAGGSAAGADGALGALGFADMGLPAAAGAIGGELGAAGGRWLGDVIGVGGDKERSIGGGVIGGAAAGAAIGSVVPVLGTAVGGVIGGVVGGAEQAIGTVICTELYRQGIIPLQVRYSDAMYAQRIDRHAYWGYLALFSPVAEKMKTSRLLTSLVKPFGVAAAYEMASRVDPSIKGSRFGKAILAVGLPLCRAFYHLAGISSRMMPQGA